MNEHNNSSGTIQRYYAFCFVKQMAFFSAVLVPFFTEWGKISLASAQFLQSWFMLWLFVLEVPTGVVADRFGRKYSLALGGFVVALAALVYGSVPRFEVFLLGEFLFALALALMSGADDAIVYDSLKERGEESDAKKVFGKARAIELAGIFVSAPIGGLIAGIWGLNVPMLASAIPFFIAGLIALTIREPKLRSESETKRSREIITRGLRYFLRHRTLRILALDAVLVASAAYFVVWLYQPLLRSLGVAIASFGFIHAGLVLVEMLVAHNFVALEKLFGSSRRYLMFCTSVTAAAFIAVAAFPNFLTLTIFIVFAGGFGLTRLELMNASMNVHIESEVRATVLSAISMVRRLALVILNPIVGLLADQSLAMALFAVGLIPLGVLLFSPLKEEMLK